MEQVAAAAALHPAGHWDVRRFRPTALIETTGEGFVEDGWSKGAGRGGQPGPDAHAPLLDAVAPAAGPGRRHVDRRDHPRPSATIRDQHDNNLGLYASITRAGSVQVGDTVHAS